VKVPGLDLTRRGRRRVIVIASAAVIGLSVPLWVPRLLSALPVFQVQRVTVVGTHYVAPDEVTRLIALEPDASVWDRVDVLEDRIRAHPMIREATVRRKGLAGLLVAVIEKRPVAFVATPELRAVNGDGRLLPIEPSRAALSLPVISGITDVEDGLVLGAGARELAGVLEELDRTDADFVSIVSEVSLAPDGGYRFVMLPTADAGSVFLPSHDPVGALHRVSLALGQIEDRRVVKADARFDRQVVITRAEGR